MDQQRTHSDKVINSYLKGLVSLSVNRCVVRKKPLYLYVFGQRSCWGLSQVKAGISGADPSLGSSDFF